MMDDLTETQTLTAGERLRAAREEKGLGLDDVAAQTRIPRRHLESLELGEWSKLPAPTYTIGFARSYAGIVGLDRAEIADQLRGEMGGQRATTSTAEVFEPADPARTMPKWLVFAAIAAVILLVLLMNWMRNRSLEDDPSTAEQSAPAATAPAAAPAPAALPAASGPVVLTANDQVWLRIRDGATTLKEGVLEAGQSFEVPAGAKAPVLSTGKPEALRISVGTADAPPVGPAATTVSNVSLLGPDLMRAGGANAAPAPAPTPRPAG
jgi:cytoskeletal protein RodZ